METNGIIIIGAGEAGTRAALALRERGFAGRLRLLGAEPHLPYERPPLSKASLTSGDISLPAIAADFAASAIEYLPGVAVTAIDRAGHSLATSDGQTLHFGQLILATGARARQLRLPGGELALTLRSHDDAIALRAQLLPGRRIIIIGGGFIGLELASSARQLGCDVLVLEAQRRLLARAVPAELAEILAARHRQAGVRFVLGTGIACIKRAGDGLAVDLTDGSQYATDCVIAGIGAAPDTALAGAAGLEIDNGIAVDEFLATSDPDISAIGDCASFPSAHNPARRIRLEAWRNAQDHGNYIAARLTGAQQPYRGNPWFWSDQYNLHLQITGHAEDAVRHVTREISGTARILFHLDAAGKLVAASGLGPLGEIARDMRLAEMLVMQGASPDPAALANPAGKLKQLLRS